MKLFPILILSGAAMSASAQTAQQESALLEAWIGVYHSSAWSGVSAYQHLQTDSPIELSMSGTETIGGTTHTFSSVLYWNLASTSTGLPQVELDDYENGAPTPVRRYVGDGRTLWFYDVQNSRFSANPYSYYGTAPSTVPDGGYAPVLLAQLYSETKGPSSDMVRLLREVNPSTDTGKFQFHYESWAPGYLAEPATTTPGIFDPLVPTRQYVDAGTTYWALYGCPPNTSNTTRTVGFRLLDVSAAGDQSDFALQEIDLADSTPNRFLSWTMIVTDPATIGSSTVLGAPIFSPSPASMTAGWQQIPTKRIGQ